MIHSRLKRFFTVLAFISIIFVFNNVLFSGSHYYSTIGEMFAHMSSFIPFFSTKDFSKCLKVRSQSDLYEYLMEPKPCTTKTTVLWLIKSSVYRNGLRFALRKTWAQNVSEKFSRIFLIGSLENNQSTTLVEENKIFGDILQGKFIDSILNVKDKVFMGIQYAKKHCQNLKYFIIIDDDTVVLPWNLLTYLKRFDDVDELYAGFFFPNNRPVRNKLWRWYVSSESYSCNIYPRYASGQLIILNYKSLLKLDTLYREYEPISMDDSLIGVLAVIGDIEARELPWNLTTQIAQKCTILLEAHSSKSTEGLIGCHNADGADHQKRLWIELCYSSLSLNSDKNLVHLFCNNYDIWIF